MDTPNENLPTRYESSLVDHRLTIHTSAVWPMALRGVEGQSFSMLCPFFYDIRVVCPSGYFIYVA